MLAQSILINDYRLFKNIGKGSFGEVYLAVKKNERIPYAVKKIDLRKENNRKMLKYLNYEISIMKDLDHPNIIKLVDFIQTHNNYYVIMEYCSGGSLSSHLKKYGRPFPIEIIQYFMRQIVEGLKYIHSKRIIHRDIKLDNILISFKSKEDKLNDNLLKSQIKIIDFGLAIKLDPGAFAKTVIGTPLNMDPILLRGFNQLEINENYRYDEKADIWSLGTICYQMYTGQNLFEANNLIELKEKVKLGDYTIPTNCELYNEIISFLNSMIQYEGENRLSAKELSEHPFLTKNVSEFSKVDLDLISNKISGNSISMNSLRGNTTIIFALKGKNKKLVRFTNNLYNNNFNENNNYLQNGNDSKLNELERIERNLIDINQKEKMEEIKKQNIRQIEGKKDINDRSKYINGILYEYQEAKEYFKNNNLIKQEQDASIKCTEIQNINAKLRSGIPINNVPSPVNPEYIYGCSTQERNNKFKEILNNYYQDKNKLETEIKLYQKTNMTENGKQILQNNNLKLQKLNFIIKELEKKYNNIWVPAPIYVKENKNCQVEKISYVNCDFSMKIQLKKLDNKKENINFIIFLKINELTNINKEIKLNYQENFYDEWIWNINYNEWKNIDNNNDHFILGVNVDKNYLNQNVINKDIKFDISKIVNGQVFSFNLIIPTPRNEQITMIVTITPIFPEGKRYYVNELQNCITIHNILPAFNGKSPFTKNIPK